jgi:hypothetical protein
VVWGDELTCNRDYQAWQIANTYPMDAEKQMTAEEFLAFAEQRRDKQKAAE